MTARGRPRRAFVLALLAACGAGASASRGTDTGPRHEPVAGDEDGYATPVAGEARAPQHAGCLVRSARSFVAFSEGMSLDDFDLAATESKRLMAVAEDTLCLRASELEPSGALAADLAAHRLTLFEVVFVRDDASAADVGLRRIDGPEDPRGDYRVAAVRTAQDGWRLVSVSLAR